MHPFVASSRRPLALRMRPDLVVETQSWQGREYWLVKDPLTLKYYRFEAEEFALLEMLDGQKCSEEIRDEFAARFAPQRISAAELEQLIANLHRSHLVLADAPGQGQELLARQESGRRKKLWQTLSSFLALRFRGFDPDGLLTRLDRWCGWMFSLPAALLSLALVAAALALVASEWDVFRSRLPEFQSFFAVQNWLLLAVTLALTKVLHEFGHGLACKRFGGECHEMGVMLLVFTPCLYCNVSDAWMIPSKWRRAAIGAAGMYVELNLAAIATFLWWFSQPGLLNHLCLNVMFVSSVSTLLFNGNPLLRYDGYYILSDLLEIPNLRQKSNAVIQRFLGYWLLGLAPRRDPFLPPRHRWAFGLYAAASSVYGWLVTFSIFWFLYRVLEPYGLKVIGQMLAGVMVFSLLVVPLVRLVQFLLQPRRGEPMNYLRMAIGLGSVAAGIAVVLAVPLPYYVACSLELAPRRAARVYVDVPGHVQATHVDAIQAAAGRVAAGQPLVELDDVDARLATERISAQRDKLAAKVDGMRQAAYVDDRALLELAQVEEALHALDVQLDSRQRELAKLTIRAPVAGVFVPPPARAVPAERRTTLAVWSGRPLETRNVGSYLEASTLIGSIAQPGQFEAILAIPQEEMDFVHAGQEVELFLAQTPGRRLRGQIAHMATEQLKSVSPRLAARGGGDLATKTTEDGREVPLAVVYQASVPLDDPASGTLDDPASGTLDDSSGELIFGGTGRAKIHAGWQSLGQRLWRGLCQTFRFSM